MGKNENLAKVAEVLVKVLADESANVSWNLLSPENLFHDGHLDGGLAYDADPQACAYPVHQWFREYAKEKVICE